MTIWRVSLLLEEVIPFRSNLRHRILALLLFIANLGLELRDSMRQPLKLVLKAEWGNFWGNRANALLIYPIKTINCTFYSVVSPPPNIQALTHAFQLFSFYKKHSSSTILRGANACAVLNLHRRGISAWHSLNCEHREICLRKRVVSISG